MDETLMHQCKLERKTAQGSLMVMIAWLPGDRKFKVGDSITLKSDNQPDLWWKVMSKGRGHPRKDIKRANFSSINDLHR